MEYSLPQNIQSIITQLNKAGFSAHVVGGCVRDLFLGRVPHDWDVTTNAHPEKVKEIFKRSYDTGLKHGTVTVMHEGTCCEITTWRTESAYRDHRRPDQVVFTNTLEEDLRRRDFTMNAMAWHPVDGLTDPFGGREDIKSGVIRCVGDADQRFSEDALRMLRAIRFSAQLGFAIEADTLGSIISHCQDIRYVSAERIQAECNKILESANPAGFALIWETGLGAVMLPEMPSFPEKWQVIASRATGLASPIPFLWGLLFLLSSSARPVETAVSILQHLKYDNNTVKALKHFMLAFDELKAITARNVRKAASAYGREAAAQALAAKSLLGSPVFSIADFLPSGESGIGEKDSHPSHMRLSISGLDLEALGLSGKNIGQLLSLLGLCVIERPECNDHALLLCLARHILTKTIHWR